MYIFKFYIFIFIYIKIFKFTMYAQYTNIKNIELYTFKNYNIY